MACSAGKTRVRDMARDTSSGDVSNAETHRLEELGLLSTEQIQVLASRWITTVEEFVSSVAAGEAKTTVAHALDMSDDQMTAALQKAEEAIGQVKYAKLITTEPGGARGLILTEEQKKELGI